MIRATSKEEMIEIDCVATDAKTQETILIECNLGLILCSGQEADDGTTKIDLVSSIKVSQPWLPKSNK